MDKYSERIVYDAAIHIDAKVSSIVRGLEWNWPSSNSIELNEVRNVLSNFYSPNNCMDTVK